ncbi:unknown [Clostridium sp. CAG:417]|nr:unknown [Clostridium sp. CAG:417]
MKSKTILISNSNDYNKFLRKLSIYKSILYCNTLFVVKSNINDNMIDYIINALNIKIRKKRITYIYDSSCKLIDDNTKSLNICGFKDDKCYVQRNLNNGKCNGCCRKCLYQTNKGCPTKNLSCKLFNCSEVTSRYNTIKYDDLKILKLLSLKNRIIIKSDYFSRREDVLKDLYAYTLSYSTLRILYRIIINCIKLNKKNKKVPKK